MAYTQMDLKNSIYELIARSHNPNLIEQSDDSSKPNYNANTSPNSNTIYHLYNDGQITGQKGAWAYLNRSEFDIKYDIGYKFDVSKFPIKRGKQFGYAIVSIADANKIRDMMLEFKLTL